MQKANGKVKRKIKKQKEKSKRQKAKSDVHHGGSTAGGDTAPVEVILSRLNG